MVTVTVATFDASWPSLALNVNVSVPLASALAVYENAPVAAFVMTAAPLEPFATSAYVSDALSMSVADNTPVIEPPATTDAAPFEAVGASLTGSMVTVTVATFEFALPSVTWNVKRSVPFAFGPGVYVNAPVDALVSAAVPFVPF